MKLTFKRLQDLIRACNAAGVQELSLGDLKLTMSSAKSRSSSPVAAPASKAAAEVLKEADKLSQWFQQPLPFSAEVVE